MLLDRAMDENIMSIEDLNENNSKKLLQINEERVSEFSDLLNFEIVEDFQRNLSIEADVKIDNLEEIK
jgi:DNA anti-recombination protein RmuC